MYKSNEWYKQQGSDGNVNNRTEVLEISCESNEVPFTVYNYLTKTWELRLSTEQLKVLDDQIMDRANEPVEVEPSLTFSLPWPSVLGPNEVEFDTGTKDNPYETYIVRGDTLKNILDAVHEFEKEMV